MSGTLGIYDRVRITTDRFRADGVPAGSIGYIIEAYADDAFEVEVSDPSTGETRALVVARPVELERADEPPPERDAGVAHLTPVTNHVGFIGAPLEEVASTLMTWRRKLYGRRKVRRVDSPDGLACAAGLLAPLTNGCDPRELLVRCAGGDWTALVVCGADGSDVDSPVSVLTNRMRRTGVVVKYVGADEVEQDDGPYGVVGFALYDGRDQRARGTIRSVQTTQDGAHWDFDAVGPVQPFEDQAAYSRRREADRFTRDMLVDYCAQLGIRPLELDFYRGPSVLIESPNFGTVSPKRFGAW